MKPVYRVPSMAEIQAIPWNGLKVVSTFSGAGGSCLGYRMAGCRVVWASEFVSAAQAVYKLNHPNSILDTRDIRTVKAEEILEATGLEKGEIDIFDGSPPCSGFSSSGTGAKGWGVVKDYSDKAQRVDDLFFEYVRLVDGLQPKVFVAENVVGLVQGKAKGYFKQILQRMKDCGYLVSARVLDAGWLGVPQTRRRLIFVGVRNDLERAPVHPSPLKHQHAMQEVLGGDVSHLICGDPAHVQKPGNTFPRGRKFRLAGPCPTVQATECVIGGAPHKLKTRAVELSTCDETGEPLNVSVIGTGRSAVATHFRRMRLSELRKVSGFPGDFALAGRYSKRWERLGRAVPPVMMCAIAAKIRDDIFDGGR